MVSLGWWLQGVQDSYMALRDAKVCALSHIMFYKQTPEVTQ